ncbi:MAG: TonB-dependent receptor [Thermoanaerobaculia bacterium]
MKRTLGVYIGLTLLLAAGGAWAQSSGEIDGQISREDGTGIGGVAVVVNESGDATLTGNDGGFGFANVAPGTYSLTFTLGDNVATEEGVEVSSGATATVEKSVDWDISFAETITVISASRRAERIVDAPAAVTLVTEQDIEKQAAHGQLPKLLEFTPGAEVTQSGLYDYNLNTRGFNSSLNRRVATLIDGRDISVPFLGAQEWAAVSFPLDDVANLELVRGPSAALYGANASSGVLNMVTKAPGDSQGGLLRLAVGELSTTNADFRWATESANGWGFKLVGGIRNTGDFTVSRNGAAEYTVPCGGAVTTDCLPQEGVPLNPLDDDEIFFGTLRVDKSFANGHLFTFETGDASVEGPAFQTGIGRVQLVDVERPFYRGNYSTRHWNFLSYTTTRKADKQTALASGNNISLDTERTGFEIQTNWDSANGKVRFVAGASTSSEDISSIDPATGRQTLVFQDISNDKSAFFAQLDWNASEKVKIVLAGRSDENDLHASQFSPKASVVYSINPNNTLRLTYNEAFQVANYSEFFLQADVAAPIPLNALVAALAGVDLEATFCAPFGVTCGYSAIRVLALGNRSLNLEEIETVELGYSGILGGKAFLTVDYYQSDNTNFITDLIPQFTALGVTNPNFAPYQPPSAIPAPVAGILLPTLQAALGANFFVLSNNLDGSPILVARSYSNFGDVDTEGIDLGLNYYVDDNWTVMLSLSNFDFTINNSQPGFDDILQPNTPESKGSFGFTYVAPRWDFGLSARWVDSFRWVVGPFVGTVASYTTADLTANYKVNDHVKVGLNVANAFDEAHWESFGGDILERRALGSVTFSW